MEDDELLQYFGHLMKAEGEIPTEAMVVIGKLIRLTLEYRDRLKKEKNEILTVEETKRAADIYTTVLRAGLIPPADDKIINLVIIWLREINGIRPKN